MIFIYLDLMTLYPFSNSKYKMYTTWTKIGPFDVKSQVSYAICLQCRLYTYQHTGWPAHVDILHFQKPIKEESVF